MFNLKIAAAILISLGLLLQTAKCQSVKGGSRSVKGGSYSQHRSQTYTRQEQAEAPIQSQSYPQSHAQIQTSCDTPSPPMNGKVSCERKNNRHICTGECLSGTFPDGTAKIQLECLQHEWTPYSSFPSCSGSNSGGQSGYSSYSGGQSGSYAGGQSGSSSYRSGGQSGSYREGQSASYSGGQRGSYGGGHGYGQYEQGQYGHGQYQQMQQKCEEPKSPMNGRSYCSMANGQWSCQGTCNPGYKFPGGSLQMTLSCNDRDGEWLPTDNFPDCILLCHPECENGGQCGVHNTCKCSSGYRGIRCQYAVSLCDFDRFSSGSLLGQCSHLPEYTECHISCPPGMIFHPHSTSMYRCTVDGLWNPPTPPECVSDSLCERPPPPKNGRIECSGNSEVMLCKGTCMPGYLFPDGFLELSTQCVRKTGEWSSGIGFPDCKPTCSPACENGGECLGHNKCLCSRGYRGGRCQYPKSNCDGHERFASVEWSCSHTDRETKCKISCGQTGSELQPPEPKEYTCSLDGAWEPDLKPICVTDYSQIDRRSSHNERSGFSSSSHRQSSGLSQSSNSHGSSSYRNSNEFGGQQSLDYDFGGQQQMDHDFESQQQVDFDSDGQQQMRQNLRQQQGERLTFGEQQMEYDFGGQQQMEHNFEGQQQMEHSFGGQQQMEHNFDGQQSVDYDFNNEGSKFGSQDQYGQSGSFNAGRIQPQTAKQDHSMKQESYMRQNEGKEEFDSGFQDGTYKEREVENGDVVIDTHVIGGGSETKGNNLDVFSVIEKVSSFHGICSVWGYHHYRSFDGGLFTFPSSCPYVLASKCGHDDLVISLLTECDSHAPCERTVEMKLQENTFLLSYQRGLVENGMSLAIPTHVGELTVEKIARYLVARLTVGFTIWINEENTVLIVANQFMKNQTCGMCGNFDGYLDPKFIRQDGSKTSDLYSFANSWKRDPDGICVDNVPHDLPCNADTREKRLSSDKANLLCASLYNIEFNACSEFIDPDLYYAKCQMDCCSTMSEIDCECATLSEFVLECSRSGVDMKNGWRKPGLCPMICTNGTEYSECGPPCPATCDDQEPTCQQERCVDGCHCPKGTVLEDGHCISTGLCPCHHGENIYASGETMNQDCNKCICLGGNWQCTDSLCPATCTVSGPHFETFDGLTYDFSGECSHFLVDADGFNIQIDYSNNCRDIVSLTSVCIRSITIHTTEGAVVKLKQTMEVSVNGREMLSLPVLAPGIYVGQATSKYIRAQLTNSGLEILWDMHSSIQVYAPVELYQELRGLCGTFTKNQQDDFLTPEGDTETTSDAFAQKWKVDETCIDYSMVPGGREQDKPCDRYPERRIFAVRVCSVIQEEDYFKECHSLVDYQRFFENCLEDVCGCMQEATACTCLSLSNYAAECAEKGLPLAWRQNMPVCGIPCPMGQIYESCANPCSYTCSEIAHSYSNCREQCVEGCVCPPGQTLDVHGECVAVSSCSCVHSGHMYPPEFMQRRGKEMCECSQGQWACHDASPSELILTPPPHIATECNASANLEATDCVSECPLTCANLHHHQPCTIAICQPGCKCKKGYIMDTTSGKCVKPLDCPCHHSGKSFQEGEQVLMDCNTCTCESGVWNCDKKACPGLCSAWGDSHYETFDGRLFDFEGSCDYVMVKTHVSDTAIFSVIIQNIPCSGNGGSTCGKSLAITLGQQSVTLTRDHPLPVVPENSPLTVSSIGMFTLVESDIGISVQWDRSSRVYVIANPIWESKLHGLCGDFNSDSSDDFRSPSGGIPLVLAKDFADSWRVHKYCKPASQPRNACDKNPERRTWSRHKCSVLKSELFKPCHYQVEVEEYFKRCVQDSCACNSGGDCECLCAVVSAYAQKCSRRGVVIPWRSQDLCPVQCESCDRYNPCISLCPAPNCDTYLNEEEEPHSCSRDPCVDGCEPKPCEKGLVYQSNTNMTCIPEEFCTEKPCTVIDGMPYREGERIMRNDFGDACQSCYCRRGEVECIGVPCLSTTSKPVISTTFETCELTGWTDWISSIDPSDNDGNDAEDLENLVSLGRIPCPLENVTNIQCRVIATQEPLEADNREVTCSLESNGLQCKNSYKKGPCEDYEMRVFCQCHEEVTCPPGQQWNECAFSCDDLCHSLEADLEDEGACKYNKQCVPGCVREVCQPPMYARDAETCVTPDKCTCRISSGYVLAPGEVITDGCQKCQCLNNSLICSTILKCKEQELPPAPFFTEETYIYETVTPEVRCKDGWSDWHSLHLPDLKGERESIEDLIKKEFLSCSIEDVSNVQCREAKTSKVLKQEFMSSHGAIYCDLRNKGFVCNNKNMPRGQTCQDYEIRAFCRCSKLPGRISSTTTQSSFVPAIRPVTSIFSSIPTRPPVRPVTSIFSTIPTRPPVRPVTSIFSTIPTRPPVRPAIGIVTSTISCSYWSDWINKGKPKRGKKHGDKEDTRPFILQQTEGFCLDGAVTDIECREVSTDKDYTETNEEKLVCNINKGFHCQNKHQSDGRCLDYKIRYFCTCGEEQTARPLFITTPPSSYIYPCSELIPLIDGPKPLPDSKIKASTSESPRSGPDAIKFNSKGRRKAWIPERSDAKQFVEVDLSDVRAIYGIVTKGKEDADEWVTSYQLLYSRDGVSYSYYQDENDNNKVFTGNYDDTIEVKHILSKPFEARYIRVEPLSWEEKIALRLDLLGCAKAITTTARPSTEIHVPFEVTTISEEGCQEPMGLENKYTGEITASSFYNPSTSPDKARMGSDTAWVAGITNVNQYLQVEFPEESTLTGVITRGREDVPQWVLSYMVAHSEDGEDWEKVTDENDKPVIFDGNDDQDTRVTNMFPAPIQAKYIRIIPLSWKGKISMQIEVLGCLKPSEEEEEERRAPVPPLDLTKACNTPMGLENGLLMSSQLSASSSYSPLFTPDLAPIGSESVWAAAVQDDNQFLQIDFIDPQRVAGIITKGREDLPQWVTAFTVEFSKDGTTWSKIKNKNGDDMEFPANYDQFSTVENLFPSTIRTRFLRIRPTKWKNWISMQIEVLGCYHPEPCRDPMGLENGLISDHQLTASSETSDSHSADKGRLISIKAWSPEISDKNPYIQIDFIEPTNLTAVITKGNPEVSQWVKSFYVSYSNDSKDWKKIETYKGRAKEFTANKDKDSSVINLFPDAITARYVRIIPKDWHRWIALRIELLGCFHEKACRDPMGLENGLLADAQITASSSADTETTPSHARLNDKYGWVPDFQFDKHPYLQVDFLEDKNITGVITKGAGHEDKWVTEFKITISDDNRKWYPLITDFGDDVIFNANEDRDTPMINLFPEPVFIRYFRIVPLGFEKGIGLRVEFLGCYHPQECTEPMGMESGSIFDFQLDASSFRNDELSPAKARLDSDTAWAPNHNDNDPYIQVDFMVPTVIRGLMTRGRNDANEWVKEYRIEYSTDGEIFESVYDTDGTEKRYLANSDSDSSVTNLLTDALSARIIRIIPTESEKHPSMRFEFLGCFEKARCMEPMGLENGQLEDSHITASSSKSKIRDPTNARLQSETSWMPDSFDDEPYIQVDFLEPRNISAVITKGDASEPAWVTAYKVIYGEESNIWNTVKDEEEQPIIFSANKNNESPAINVFPRTIEARFVRIVPIDWKDNIALRLEILGCYHPYEETLTEPTTIVTGPGKVLPFPGRPTEPTMMVLCPDPMEPELSLMKNAKIRASSSALGGNPSRIHLNTPASKGQSGAWVPKVDDLHSFVFMELPEPSWLTSIDIQGREDEENWVKAFRVIASVDNSTWMPVFGMDGEEVMEGNEDQHEIVTRFFNDPTEARYVKIIPETWHKWPSFRVDLKGCRISEASTPPKEIIPEYPELCPELANYPNLAQDCPEECPEGQLCNGESCVDPIDCSCVHDGTLFKVSDKIIDDSCRECDCALEGHSICKEKECEPCSEGAVAILSDDCTCSCEECSEGKTLCPTSLECIPEERWCDGTVDCPDDETNCIVIETTSKKPRKGIPTESRLLPEIEVVTLPTGATVTAAVFPVVPESPGAATCNIMGTHINTFDGQDITYDPCNHVVMKDIKNGKYNVTNHKECNYASECKHWIEINYLNQRIKVQSDLKVEVNGHSYSTGQLWRLSKKTKMNLIAKRVGEQVIIRSAVDNFTITYDTRGHVEIDVTPKLQYKIGGLCGYYTGKIEDDQRKPNGRKAFTSKEFAESWAIRYKGKECKPLICPHEEMLKSMELCHKLKENPFIPCGKILPLNQFIEFCMSTTCECLLNKKNSENKCKCDGLLPFVEACETKLGSLAVRNWRLIHECHTECPEGMEWNDCGPSCQLTCDASSAETLRECSGKCVPGCFCPPGTVLNDDVCIPPDQCRDQVCQGFGDPHFKTFDGLFFPFQAVGSFLIVSDTGNNFEVNGLSRKCGLFNPITCLVGMEIIYGQHKISMKKGKDLKVDGNKVLMEDLPLHKDGMVILGYPGRTFVVVIPKINIEARYYEENSGFAVRVPSRQYFNKTKGLCGNCNGREDDELKNEPLNEYVCSWQKEGEREECMTALEDLPEIVDRIPLCEKLKDPVFEACHPLVDIDIYIDACNFDATHSGENEASFCKTAMEYGRQCCQIGIAIDDWPSALECNIDCPSGMEYKQCHKGCPQTCLSKNSNGSIDESCKQLKTDGCFCPEGKILKDGTCADIEKCATCDEEGHVPGDKWDDGPCKHCHCREDLNVECVLEVCPSKPVCSRDEILTKREIELNTLSCCERYVCVPKEEDCPTMDVPKCKSGEVAKVHTGFDGCPYLKCECDPVLCAPLIWPEDLEDGQQSLISNLSCCPVVKVICLNELCPDKPECEDKLELVEVEGKCCTEYKCKPPKDVCVYTHTFKVVKGFQSLVEQIETDTTIYQPGEEWEDGLCEKCSCVESNGQYVPLCVMEYCTTLEDMPDNKDYVLEEVKIPDKCCPDIFKTACRDDDGNVYGPGEQWQDEDDPCMSYMCKQEGTGEVIKIRSVINCTECPRTSVLFPPSKALGQCCGFCKPTMCEDGDDLYSIGDTWTSADDSCRMAECVSEYGKVHVVYTKRPCPVIPDDCPSDKIIPDKDGCCNVCNLTSEISCSTGPIPEADTIGFFTYDEPSKGGICINEEPVPQVLQCKGACHSRSYYSLEDGEFKDMCQCCKVNITVDRPIKLRCPNGNIITKTFLQPESCQCSKCAPKTGGSKKNTLDSQSPWIQDNKKWNTEEDFVFAQSPIDHERFTDNDKPSNRFGNQQNPVQQQTDYGQFEQNQVQQEEDDDDVWN